MAKRKQKSCHQCRSRHVKCDTQRPICGQCRKTERTCSEDNKYIIIDTGNVGVIRRNAYFSLAFAPSQRWAPLPTSVTFETVSACTNLSSGRKPSDGISKARQVRDTGTAPDPAQPQPLYQDQRRSGDTGRDVVNLLPGGQEHAILAPPSAFSGGAFDAFLKVPIELDSVGKRLVINIFQSEFQRPHRNDWFSVGLTDQAVFLQVLSNSALQLDNVQDPHGGFPDTKLSLVYFQLAVTDVQRRLDALQRSHLLRTVQGGIQKPDVCEEIEKLIGAVTGFMCSAAITSSKTKWETHRMGLVRLIQAHGGGLERFEIHLRATVSWVELRGALMYDTPPYIPLPAHWLDAIRKPSALASTLRPTNAACIRDVWALHFPHQKHQLWLGVFEELEQQIPQLKDDLQGTGKTLALPLWSNVLIHQLLSIPQQQALYETNVGMVTHNTNDTDSDAACIAELCRTALILFLGRVWRAYGVTPAQTTEQVKKQAVLLRRSRECLYSVATESPLCSLVIWALCLTLLETLFCIRNRACVNHPEVESTHLQEQLLFLKGVSRETGTRISTMGDIRHALDRVLWTDGLCHEQEMSRLQELIQRTATSS